jgi:hypothetical protein
MVRSRCSLGLQLAQMTLEQRFGPVTIWPERPKWDFSLRYLVLTIWSIGWVHPCRARSFQPNIDLAPLLQTRLEKTPRLTLLSRWESTCVRASALGNLLDANNVPTGSKSSDLGRVG